MGSSMLMRRPPTTTDYEYTLTVTMEADSEEEVNCVQRSGPYQTKLYSDINVGSSSIRFQIDTGATCNVVRKSDLPRSHPIHPTTKRLSMYNGSKVEPIGTCTIKMIEPRSNKKFKMECVVVRKPPVSTIGAGSTQQMGLIHVPVESVRAVTSESHIDLEREAIMGDFSEVFKEEIGCFEGSLHLGPICASSPAASAKHTFHHERVIGG